MNVRSRIAALFALALAACSAAKDTTPHSATERLADSVMDAVTKSDMRPVLGDFVPERRAVLLDPAGVAKFHEYSARGGTFVGARDITTGPVEPLTHRLTAYYQNGSEQTITMYMNPAGKIVHFRLR